MRGGFVMGGSVERLNPKGLHKNPAYSQAVVTTGNVKTVYVGGQNAVDASGNVVGSGDIGVQAEQIFKNLETALAAGGARLDDVIKWNIYVVAGQPIQPAFEVFQRVWGERSDPPLITGVFVSGLAQPDYLMELEAVAVVPEP
jgi:enamine deaminase RidA (YjgF/YER057c/UK114 family)